MYFYLEEYKKEQIAILRLNVINYFGLIDHW